MVIFQKRRFPVVKVQYLKSRVLISQVGPIGTPLLLTISGEGLFFSLSKGCIDTFLDEEF